MDGLDENKIVSDKWTGYLPLSFYLLNKMTVVPEPSSVNPVATTPVFYHECKSL